MNLRKQKSQMDRTPVKLKESPVKRQFTNRFKGKQDFVTKDGHYGVVSNTKNPIQKNTPAGIQEARATQLSNSKQNSLAELPPSRQTRNIINLSNAYLDSNANSSFGMGQPNPMQQPNQNLNDYGQQIVGSDLLQLQKQNSVSSTEYVTGSFPNPGQYSDSPVRQQSLQRLASLGSPNAMQTGLVISPVKRQKSMQKFNIQKYKDVFGPETDLNGPMQNSATPQKQASVRQRMARLSAADQSKSVNINELIEQQRINSHQRPSGVDVDPSRGLGLIDTGMDSRYKKSPSMVELAQPKSLNYSPNMYYGDQDQNNGSRSASSLLPNVHLKHYSGEPQIASSNNIHVLHTQPSEPQIATYNKNSFYNRFLQTNKQIKTATNFDNQYRFVPNSSQAQGRVVDPYLQDQNFQNNQRSSYNGSTLNSAPSNDQFFQAPYYRKTAGPVTMTNIENG